MARPSRRRRAPPQDEVGGNCKPHGEERAQARASNHLPLAPPSPVAPSFEGRLRRLPQDEAGGIADLMVRSAAKPRVSNHGRLRASMAGFVVNNNESTVALPPWRPPPWQRALLQMKRAARGGPCGCFHRQRDGAGMALHAKRPALWVPGAIPTVDFLLYRFGAVVKKMGVKSHVERGLGSRPRVHRAFASNASSLTRVRQHGAADRARIAQLTRGFAEPEKTCEFVCATCHRVRAFKGER